MTKPTLDEDLTWLANICDQANANETRSHACEAVARIRAALADKCDHHSAIAIMQRDISHLQYGARFLAGMLKRAERDGLIVPEAATWLEAERARVGRGDV